MTAWVIDLDGVMWRGDRPIEGSLEAVAELLDRGDRVLFCTNNSTVPGTRRRGQLIEGGLPEGIEVVTSADAAATLLMATDRVLAVGAPGLVESLATVGCQVTRCGSSSPSDADPNGYTAVVVGLDQDFDYLRLDRAAAVARGGARLIATNSDSTFPGAGGLQPGAGAIVAAVETASGARAEVAGKPYEPMAALLRRRLAGGAEDSDAPSDVVVVGDRLETDGRLAQVLGWPFALVLSGVTAEVPRNADPPVDRVAPMLSALVAEAAR